MEWVAELLVLPASLYRTSPFI